MFKIILILIISPFTSYGENIKDKVKKSLIEISTNRALVNEIVVISPIKNHHFNLEAPQECGSDATIDPSTREIGCQFHASGKQSILVSVCDDSKTYCKQETVKILVDKQKSDDLRMEASPLQKTSEDQAKRKKMLMKNFVSISPKALKKKLKETNKKGALIMVSTDWCPPCNASKEFLLPTESFNELTKDLILVYVDGDNTKSINEWRPVLKTKFYPSFVVMNSRMERTSVLTGYAFISEFKKWMKASLLNIDDSIEDLEKRVYARLNGEFYQRFLDLFKTEDQILKDEKKWLDALRGFGRIEEKIAYMDKKPSTKELGDYNISVYTASFMGEVFKDLSVEEKAKRNEDLEVKIFKEEKLKKDSASLYSYILKKRCSSLAVKEDDKLKKECDANYSKFFKFSKNWIKENKKELTDSELLLSQIVILKTEAEAYSIAKETKNKSSEAYKSCLLKVDSLIQTSPLKEKSRYARLLKIPCMKGEGSESVDVLKSLVNDYPYEGTFYSQLARYYLQKKEYSKALIDVEKAVKYSYGDSWVANLKLKATILESKGDFIAADKAIEEAMSQIKLNKDSRMVRYVKELRAMKARLKEKLAKSTNNKSKTSA